MRNHLANYETALWLKKSDMTKLLHIILRSLIVKENKYDFYIVPSTLNLGRKRMLVFIIAVSAESIKGHNLFT